MALNLSDPGAIVGAYESIIDVRNTNNWLLLQYSKFDEIALFDHGSGGLRELKRSIEDPEQVHIGFYREEVDGEPGFVVINYIPTSIPAVKKARALVHSRRVGAIFKVRIVFFIVLPDPIKHQTTLTVDDLAQLTPEAVHSSLVQEDEPDTPNSASTFQMGRAAPTSNPNPNPNTRLRSRTTGSPPANKNKTLPDPGAGAFVFEPVRRVASEAPAPNSYPNTHQNPGVSAQPMVKSASMFSSFIRRKKKTDSTDEGSDDPGVPPTPPKDKGKFTIAQQQQQLQHPQHQPQAQKGFVYPPPLVPVRGPAPSSTPYEVPQRSRTGSLSEYAVISHASSSNMHGAPVDEFGGMYGEPGRWQQDQGRGQVQSQSQGGPVVPSMSLPLRGKWTAEPMDAAERLRKRQEELRQRHEEEEEARREEERRKKELKRKKEEEMREEEEAEARRRASFEDELQRIATERRRKEKLEKEEEERKRIEIEERKRVDRERRMEEHRRLEEWRREQARMADEAARRAEETRRREEVERRKKIQLAEAKVKKNHNVDTLVSGWVTMQTNDSLLWKRRFYKFIGTAAYFYRSPKDTQHYLDKVELRGKLRGLREWNEGYEDLEAIPHSFAIEFKDEYGHWSMFSDSEEEKYKLLGLLHHAAGL
ncbi:hypothetical protein D9615_003705 [Tricholomella constricta]|uniref:ADF-H domain-containing protein n=1 Tax=Tricholomella constricta TaxID=117010 RepID=A0A8H5HHZ8_9AGAR|nr:hypothetical protein D9615_003705 [Tricholomella constricta]